MNHPACPATGTVIPPVGIAFGPPTVGMSVLEPLTLGEQQVLAASLSSSWAKQLAVAGASASVQPGSIWEETREALADLHRHFGYLMDRREGGTS